VKSKCYVDIGKSSCLLVKVHRFRVTGSGFTGSGFRVQRFRVQRFRVQGSGFRVQSRRRPKNGQFNQKKTTFL
jgi:hypothetical protein